VKDDHLDLNSGFTEVEDFTEPDFDYSDNDESDVGRRKISLARKIVDYDPYSAQNGFRANIIASFIIHVSIVAFSVMLAVVLTLAMMFIPFMYFLLSPPVWALGLFALVGLYALLGYRFLTPTPDYNLLSVSVLILAIALVSIVGNLLGDWFVMLPNLPAFYAVAMIDSLLRISFPDQPLSNFSFLIAALLPSLFMYLGLRIKIWRQDKSNFDQ